MELALRPYEERDRGAVLDALASVVPADDAAVLDAQLDWLQRRPEGLWSWVGEHQGRVVAHLAAVPRRTWFRDGERLFAELGGAWVEPSLRRGLRRRPWIAELLERVVAEHGGMQSTVSFHLIPSRVERRLARRVLGLLAVGSIVPLRWNLVAGPRASVAPEMSIAPVERFDEQARWLWERVSGRFGASTVRDADFLNERFFDRPGRRYQALGVRDEGGILRGYAILRPAVRPGEPWRLSDWLVPPEEDAAATSLLAAVAAIVSAAGGRVVETFLPERSPWFGDLQARGFRVGAARHVLFARSAARKFGAHWLEDHWWHSPADTLHAPW